MFFIFDEVEYVLGKQPALARSIKMFLCRRYTGEKLKDIGIHFGIRESCVSHASRRIKDRMINDRKLKRNIAKIKCGARHFETICVDYDVVTSISDANL